MSHIIRVTGDPESEPVEVGGPLPTATFVLDDGTELRVTHKGDHIEVNNWSAAAMAVLPRGANMILVQPR